MTITQTTFLTTKNTNTQTLTPSFFRKTKFYYLKTKSSYKKKNFNKTQQYTTLSQKFSEKTKTITIHKKALENL